MAEGWKNNQHNSSKSEINVSHTIHLMTNTPVEVLYIITKNYSMSNLKSAFHEGSFRIVNILINVLFL